MNVLIDLTSGIVSGVVGVVSGFFLDTVKVRMQTYQMQESGLPRQNMTQTLVSIVKNQGWRSLFRGLYYPLISFPIINSILFTSYEAYKTSKNQQKLSFWDGAQNGAVAGFIVSFFATPAELIKCRMQQDQSHVLPSSKQCMRQIIQQDGYMGLMRGNTAMILRQVPGMAAQFSFYQLLKGYFVTQAQPHLTLTQAIMMAPVPVTINWLISYPQDVVKTLIQTNKTGYYRKHPWLFDGGFIDCSQKLYKARGISGFFIGLSPCLIRACYSEGLVIVAYQKIRQFLWQHRTQMYL